MTMPPNDRDPIRRTPIDYVRRSDGSLNILPLVLGALLLGSAIVVLFGDGFGGPDRARTGLSDPTTKTPVETGK